jgi:4-nitrophenyl phosphatase
VRRYPLYIFDLDGTLWRGWEAIPGAMETVAQLRAEGSQIRYLTNNSSTERKDYVHKLRGLGFEASLEEVYSSATGSASKLVELGMRTVHVLGEPGLVNTLREAGLFVTNADEQGAIQPDLSLDNANAETLNRPPVGEAPSEPRSRETGPDALLVGICRRLTYPLLNAAMQAGLKGARFFATNADMTFPMEGGALMPGAGSIVAAVEACIGRSPEVLGKPHPYLVELILREAGVRPSDALCVGDRLDTDILSGQAAGCDTLLVLTGVEKEALEGQAWAEDVRGLLN